MPKRKKKKKVKNVSLENISKEFLITKDYVARARISGIMLTALKQIQKTLGFTRLSDVIREIFKWYIHKLPIDEDLNARTKTIIKRAKLEVALDELSDMLTILKTHEKIPEYIDVVSHVITKSDVEYDFRQLFVDLESEFKKMLEEYMKLYVELMGDKEK